MTLDLTDPRGLPLTQVPEARAMASLSLQESELGNFALGGGPGVYTDGPDGEYTFTSDGPVAFGTSPATRQPQNAVANAKLARDPSLQRAVTLSRRTGQPSSGLRRAAGTNTTPAATPAPGMPDGLTPPDTRSETPDPRVSSADVLEALHAATGAPIVADYYTRLYPARDLTVQNQSLFSALNQLADTMRLRWTRQDGWLQFRSTTFYNDRLKEVPNRLLSRWAESRRRHGTLTLEDLVEIVQLSDAQLDAREMAEGARLLFGLEEWDLARFQTTRPHLRVLAGLTPAQRQEAMSDAGLALTRMPPAQQQWFLSIAIRFGGGPLQSLEELAGSTLRVDYSVPGWFQWGSPDQIHYTQWVVPLEPGRGGRRVPRPTVRERTRDAALEAARRVDPKLRQALLQAMHRGDPRVAMPTQVEASEIYPTRLRLTILCIPGATNARNIHLWFGDNDLGPQTWQ
jgi:hypothetical protein